MATTEKLLTAEEFAELPESPDGTQYELIRGELVEMPPPNPRHGQGCLTVGAMLWQFVRERQLGSVASNDGGFILARDPDTVRGPDIAYWIFERLPELPSRYTDVPPDLAVEVVSPTDAHGRVLEKALDYLDHGVRMVWTIDPEQRLATVYRSRQDIRILRDTDEIDGADVLPGFACRVADFF